MPRLATVLLIAAAPALAGNNSEPLKIISGYSFAAPNAKCYFIRQANRQLQAPEDKPRFIPLAELQKLPSVAPAANCMPDQRIIKTFIK